MTNIKVVMLLFLQFACWYFFEWPNCTVKKNFMAATCCICNSTCTMKWSRFLECVLRC